MPTPGIFVSGLAGAAYFCVKASEKMRQEDRHTEAVATWTSAGRLPAKFVSASILTDPPVWPPVALGPAERTKSPPAPEVVDWPTSSKSGALPGDAAPPSVTGESDRVPSTRFPTNTVACAEKDALEPLCRCTDAAAAVRMSTSPPPAMVESCPASFNVPADSSTEAWEGRSIPTHAAMNRLAWRPANTREGATQTFTHGKVRRRPSRQLRSAATAVSPRKLMCPKGLL